MNSTTESVSTTRSATKTPTVHLQRVDDGTIAVLTLDDPKRANAMSPQMGDTFTQHVRSLINDTALRAVIIRGAGKDFSIGGHRDMLISLGDGTRSEKELHDFMLAFYNRWLPVIDLPVPVIVVLQGDCIGVAPPLAWGFTAFSFLNMVCESDLMDSANDYISALQSSSPSYFLSGCAPGFLASTFSAARALGLFSAASIIWKLSRGTNATS